MQTQINAPLQALLQTAAMVTPDKQNSTVAAKYAQAAQQKIQMGVSPAGIEALLPGVRQQAVMSARAAQPATQGDVNQLRQMIAQSSPQQGQGIAPGVDVQMAEGGVVGFSGEFGSYTPEALAADELRVAEAKRAREDAERRKMLEFLEQAGSPLAEKYRVAAPPAEPAAQPQKKKEPTARATGTSTATTQAAPPAPASTGMIDYAKALQAMLGTQEQGFKGLEELLKPQPKTKEELDFVKRQEEEVARRRAGLESRRQQYLDLEKLREETGKATGLQDLAAFLSRAGGARSGLAGLAQATQAQVGIDAARRKEAQAAIDRRREYFDLLEQQRDTVEAMQTAISEGNMARAAAERARLEALQKAIASLRVQTSTQMYGPTLQAGQSAADTQARIASAEKLARDRNAALVAVAKAKGVRPPPGMGIGDLKALGEMVSAEFNPARPGPKAIEFLKRIPNGEQLVRDIQNNNIKPGSDQWNKEVAPKLALGAALYEQQLLSKTKFGNQPIPYKSALSLTGLSEQEED